MVERVGAAAVVEVAEVEMVVVVVEVEVDRIGRRLLGTPCASGDYGPAPVVVRG